MSLKSCQTVLLGSLTNLQGSNMSQEEKIEEILKYLQSKKEAREKVSMRLLIKKCSENDINYPTLIRKMYEKNLMEAVN